MKLTASFCLIYTLALLIAWLNGCHVAGFNSKPCMKSTNNNAYDTFERRHIMDGLFDTNSMEEWLKYLNSKGLCGRVPVQTFIQATDKDAVKSICSGHGINLQGNHCISQREFEVYNIQSKKPPNKPCVVHSVNKLSQPVVVACDAINNICLPVHYVGYTGQKPIKDGLICQ